MENELKDVKEVLHEIEKVIEKVVDPNEQYWIPAIFVSGDAYTPARQGLTIELVKPAP